MVDSNLSSADLAKLVFQDELTELYNRRYMYNYLKEKIDWKSSGPASLLMIDVDFFKEINDTHGHLEGDHVLKELSKIIKETVRPDDVAIRYAGDEFTVIMPATQIKEGISVAESIRKNVASKKFTVKKTGKELKLSISLGIASFPADGNSPEGLIDAADNALYISKRQGKNQVSSLVKEEEKKKPVHKDPLKAFPPPVFVGREKVWTDLKDVFSAVKEGNNSFVLIEGEAGSGKTRLLKELNKEFEKVATNFYYICLESETNIPYRPLVNLISRIAGNYKEEINKAWKSSSYIQQSELKRVLPVLPDPTSGEKNQDISGEEKRKLLFEGLVNILSEISEKNPLFVLLDEMQNADKGTLEVINCLDESDRGRVMVCGAARSSVLDVIEEKHPAVDDFLNEISGTELFKHIRLTSFDQETTSDLVSALLPGCPKNTDFDQKVFESTKGNPLFVEELLKNFILKKYIDYKDSNWVFQEIPEKEWHSSLDGVIQDNFILLDKTTSELVNQATVAGLQIDFNILKGMAGLNEGEVMELLDKAKAAKLIEETEPLQTDSFTFVNQKVQEVTYNQIDSSVKEALHQQVAQVAEKVHEGDVDKVAANLSYHYKKAGDKENAAKYAKRADDIASKSFRSDEASRYYERGKMIIRSKIKEAVEPLSGDLTKTVKDILRGLCATAKNMKLYPEGSQLINQSTMGLLKAFGSIFDQTEKITFSETKSALHINTVPVDPKIFGASVDEFLKLIKDHYIKSCTIQRGVGDKEIEVLLRDLDNSHDKNYSTPGYWNEFLKEKSIANIGIAQRAFVVSTPKVSGKLSAEAEKNKIELTPENTAFIRDVLRYLTAAIDNVRLYPSGSQLTDRVIKQLQEALGKLFDLASTVDFSEVEDNLLLNGNLLNSRTFGMGTQSIAKIIKNNNIKSITIKNSYTPEELEKALRIVNNPPNEEQNNYQKNRNKTRISHNLILRKH